MKPLQPSLDPAIIRAAARLLEEDPTISNLRMLQRLALRFGPKLTQAVHVTRVERRIREPALLLIRTGALNGEPADLAEGTEVAREPEVARKPDVSITAEANPTPSRDPGRPLGRRRKRGRDPRVTQDVEDALIKAFALGAATETPVEIVEAFRKLDVLRRKLRTRLAD